MRFSPSRLSTWQKCQLQAYFKYELQKPEAVGSAMIFGSAVHLGMEMLNKDHTIDEAIAAFEEELEEEPDYWNWRASKERYLRDGKDMLLNYHASPPLDGWITIAAEQKFRIPVGEHELIGIIDSILLSPDHKQLALVDYKTGAQPSQDELHLDIQFTSYVLASYYKEFWVGEEGNPWMPGFPFGEELWEYFKGAERLAYWHNLKNNKLYNAGQKTMRDFGRLYRLMEQVALAYEKELFIPSISAESCKWCPYKEECPVYFDNAPMDIKEIEEGIEVTWKS